MVLREVDCYSCCSAAYEPYAFENGFGLVRCKSCGLLYVRLRPDDMEISEAHQAGQHGGSDGLDVTGSFSRRKVATYMKILEDFYGHDLGDRRYPQRWLDIGCGHGEFLLALKRYFGPAIIARGVEPIFTSERLRGDMVPTYLILICLSTPKHTIAFRC